jgi:glycosyltransferase involved in cell wall biosynthesis
LNSPYFSIVVPTYNRADLIGKTVASILQQEFKDFEVLVVDDGSTDNTEASVRKFNDPRVQYCPKQNSERGAARNYGASLARGRYLNFFDSDDLMLPGRLSIVKQFIADHNNPAWFHTAYKIVDEFGKIVLKEYGAKHPEEKLITTNYLGCDSVFIEREFFLQNKFQEDRRMASSEDWELWLRIISRQPLLRCPEVTFHMVNHSNRSLFTISPDKIIERDTLLLHYLLRDKFFVDKFHSELPLFEADRYTFFALTLLLENRKKEAYHYLVESLKVSKKVLTRKRFWACVKKLVLA